MDLSTITDIKELKSMAYDQNMQLEIAQNNLRMIQQRLMEVEREQNKPPVDDIIAPEKGTET